MKVFEPQLFKSLRSGYSSAIFLKDLAAGTVVGIVAIPLALAFAIASGVPPNIGLLTAVIGGFIVSVLGGSNVQIAGPTGAFIVIVSGIITKFGYQGLLVASLMAGIILLLIGFLKLGNIIKYIPFPVIIGFTSGIAVIIASSQVNDFLGLGIAKIPNDFLDKWLVFFEKLDHLNLWALGLSLGTIVLTLLLKKLNPKIPSALIIIVLGTLIAQFFSLPVETIGTKFGQISGQIPNPTLPGFDLASIKDLIMPAISIAMLGAIESLLSAVIGDSMTGQRHNSNTELIAQGIANVASSLFGGLPVTGAIARTATNIKNHGQTPISGIIHALIVLLAFLFLGGLIALIPLALLAGILMIVAFNMSEVHQFRLLLQGSKSEVLVLVATFLLTVLLDLTIAIPCGILLALLSFIKKSKDASEIRVHHSSYREHSIEDDPYGLSYVQIPEGVKLIEVRGALFFGTSEELKSLVKTEAANPGVLIVKLDRVTAIDSSGIFALKEISQAQNKSNFPLIIVLSHEKHVRLTEKMRLTETVGAPNIVRHLREALLRSQNLLKGGQRTLAQKIEQLTVIDSIEADDPIDLIKKVVPLMQLPAALAEKYLSLTIEREVLSSTAVGKGICFPHPRSPVLLNEEAESIHIVYLKEKIAYPSLDGELVHTAIFIASVSYSNHLGTLSNFVRLMHDTDLVDKFAKHTPKKELIDFMIARLRKGAD